MLTESTNGTDNEDLVDRFVGEVQSSLEWAQKLLAQDSERDTGLALFVLRYAAIHERDVDALAIAIRVILRNRGEQQAVRRALALLQKFYTCTNVCAGPTRTTSQNISMLLGNEKHVRTVTTLFEEILKASEFYDVVARKYQLFIVILMCFVGHGSHEDSNFVVLHSLVFKYGSDEVAEAAALLVSTFSTNQSLRTRACERNISHSAFISLRVWVAEAIRIIAKKIDGAVALEELGVNPQRAIDILTKFDFNRKEASEMASSLVKLARFLEEDCDGVQKDLHRAIELYTKAVDEGKSTLAMCRLANLLRRGGEGAEKDIGRALVLYNRAVDGGSVEAMFELGNVFAEGSDGIEKDIVRAAELYSRAIDEGGHVGAMSNLAVLLETGWDGVEKDLRRAVELYSRSISERNDTHAMFRLASLLSSGGEGVGKDIPRALDLFAQAADRGDLEARKRLSELVANE